MSLDLLGITDVVSNNTNTTSLSYWVNELVYYLGSVGLQSESNFHLVERILQTIADNC